MDAKSHEFDFCESVKIIRRIDAEEAAFDAEEAAQCHTGYLPTLSGGGGEGL
jgi:hypothetical protein